MSDTYIIEVSSEAAGIVVREKSGFRFFAAVHKFNPLDGRVFKNAREAERAATRFLAGRLDPLPAQTSEFPKRKGRDIARPL